MAEMISARDAMDEFNNNPNFIDRLIDDVTGTEYTEENEIRTLLTQVATMNPSQELRQAQQTIRIPAGRTQTGQSNS